LWAERWDLPKKVLESLADGAEQLAGALAQGDVKGVQGLLAKLPKQAKFSDKLATLVLAHTARLAGKGLADIAADARKKEDHLKATLAQFKVDLERGVTEKVFIRSPK